MGGRDGRKVPGANFIGVDLVPTATRYPPDNARFECYDVEEEGLRNPDGSVDVVHMRFVAPFIRRLPALISEIARVLQPGGLLLLGEWDMAVQMASGGSVAAGAPAFFQFWETVRNSLRDRFHINLQAARGLPDLLQQTGAFTNITARALVVPIGPWSTDHVLSEVGELLRRVWIELASSLRPVLLAARPENQVHTLSESFVSLLEDLEETKIEACYRMVWAIKR